MTSAPSSSPFTVDVQERMVVVTIHPALSEAAWSDISQAGDAITAQLSPITKPRCLLDLSNITYMGSSTVALLVRLWKGVQSQEGRSAVLSTHPVVTQVLTLAGLDKIWTIVNSRQQAIDALGLGVPEETTLSSSGSLLSLAVIGTIMSIGGIAFREWGKAILDLPIFVPMIGAAIGLIFGCFSLFRDQSARRFVGLFCLILSLASALLLTWRLARPAPAPPVNGPAATVPSEPGPGDTTTEPSATARESSPSTEAPAAETTTSKKPSTETPPVNPPTTETPATETPATETSATDN